MLKLISILFLLSALLIAQYPQLFSQLGTPLFKSSTQFTALQKTPLFKTENKLFNQYQKLQEKTLKHGLHLDAKEKTDTKVYLQELRALQKLHDKIEKVYKRKLYKSINENNATVFFAITKIPLPFISTDTRLKKSVVQYYEKNKKQKIAYLEELNQDYKLDEDSYAFLEAMFKTKQRNQKVETRKELNEFISDASIKSPIQVIMLKTKYGYDLYLENHAYYDASIKFTTPKRKNFSSSAKLPFIGSFPAQSRTKFLSFTVQDPSKPASLQTKYTAQIGRVNPSYNENYVYALPYRRNRSYILTQGFNGKHTHKGKSAYALDFKMAIGTPIHAMRDGIVVAVESKNTEHGYSKEYMNKANHIVIQHDDGTMAMYAHLKPNGVKVKLGQKVVKHQYIGLSGNTGFSSGPHLHVHISAIKSFRSGSQSVAFKFKTKKGVVSKPIDRSAYLCK